MLFIKELSRYLGPRYSNVRTLQVLTWASYAAATLSIVILAGTLVRGGLQWKAVVEARGQLRAEQQALSEIRQVFRDSQRDAHARDSQSCWLHGVPELAARLERGARAQGVHIAAVAPDQSESDEPEGSGPSPDVKLTSQRISIKARGPYAGALKWTRWLAGPAMPIKLESIVLSPQTMPDRSWQVAMEIRIVLYSRKEVAKT